MARKKGTTNKVKVERPTNKVKIKRTASAGLNSVTIKRVKNV